MNCFRHDNEHWRTAPLWTAGPFCFCMSASNNTYNCVRTINATHNLLYCEFVTGLVTYYNLRIGKSLLFWYLLPRLGKFLRSKVPIILSIVYIWTTAALRLANQYKICCYDTCFERLVDWNQTDSLDMYLIIIVFAIPDPFETQNRVKYLTANEKEYFHNQLQQLLNCRGASCRRFSHSNPQSKILFEKLRLFFTYHTIIVVVFYANP